MTITAAKFKAQCLKLIDQVGQNQTEIIVTKRGKPKAKLVPIIEEKKKSKTIMGCMAGTFEITGDIVSPVKGLDWTGDEHNL